MQGLVKAKSILIGREGGENSGHTICSDGHARHPPCAPFKQTKSLHKGDSENGTYLLSDTSIHACEELACTECDPS